MLPNFRLCIYFPSRMGYRHIQQCFFQTASELFQNSISTVTTKSKNVSDTERNMSHNSVNRILRNKESKSGHTFIGLKDSYE